MSVKREGVTITMLVEELSNCLRIFERDRTPDRFGRNERIRKMIKAVKKEGRG